MADEVHLPEELRDGGVVEFANYKPVGWVWEGRAFEYLFDEDGEIIGHREVEAKDGKWWTWEGKYFTVEMGPGSGEDE